jgi:hypothetical protein
MAWMNMTHRMALAVLSLMLATCPAAMAGEVVQTTTAPDGSRKVTLSLRNLFRKDGADQTKSTATDGPLVRALECKERNWQLLDGVVNNDLMETPISPVTAYGVTVTAVFANLETEAPVWGFYVPANAVQDVARRAGLQPDPATPGAYQMEFPDGALQLADEGGGRWLLRCGQYFEPYDSDE